MNPERLQELFVSPDYDRLKGYLEVRPPNEHAPETIERERTPTVLRMERSRRIELPWSQLLAGGADRLEVEIAAYREWFESSWRLRPKPHAEALAPYVFRATEERPVHGIPDDLVGSFPTYTEGWVLRLASPGIHYLALPAEEGDEALDFLAGPQEYERAWNGVGKLIPVSSERPPRGDLPRPIDRTLPWEPFDPDPLPPWIRPTAGLRGGGLGGGGLESAAAESATEIALEDVTLPGNWGSGERSDPEEIARTRAALEASWGFDPSNPLPYGSYVEVLDAASAARFHRPTGVRLEYGLETETGPDGGDVTVPRTRQVWSFEPLREGDVLLRHGTSGLRYLVRGKEGAGELRLDGSEAAYQTAWESQIETIELVVEHEGDEPPREAWPFQEESELDLSPQVIVAEYRRLELRREAAAKVAEKAQTLLEELSADPERTVDEVLETSRRLVGLQEELALWEDRIRTLRERARLLGYVLVTDARKGTVEPFADFPFVGSSPDIAKLRQIEFRLEEGALYRTRRIVRFWSETVTRRWTEYVVVRVFGDRLRIPRRRTRVEQLYRNHQYLEWTKVSLDLDPLVAERVRLEEEGFETFVFELTPNGWRDEQGSSLSELMSRCQADEALRRRTAVLLPVYEQSLLEGRIKSRWRVIRRPLPGVVPIGLPALFFQETLSYRNGWVGTELGELLQSVNLAPGERRRVSVARTITESREETREITSLLDVTTSASDELATEIEKEARSERERSQSSSWNASASASYFGFVSASGGGGGSSSSSAKDFARNFQRIARKAASSINRNVRQEVRTTSRTDSSVSVSEETSGEVENLNTGRTLNLLFYQLRNVYLGGIFLDELGFTLLRSRELIAGTGIHDAVTSRRQDLRGFLDAVAGEWRFLTLLGVDPVALLLQLVDGVERDLIDEYLDPATRARIAAAAPSAGDRLTAGVFDVPEGELPAHLTGDGSAESGDKESRRERLERRVTEVSGLIWALRETGRPVSGVERLALPSRAVYLDAKIGLQRAAEPYSERMREAEYIGRVRDAELVHARALTEAGRAAALSMQAAGSADAPALATPHIEQVEVDTRSKRMTLRLNGALTDGLWLLQVDGRAALPITPGSGGDADELTLEWTGPTPWWAADAEAGASVALLDALRRVRVVRS